MHVGGQKPSVGIIGAHGYAGRELARLLLQHPFATLSAVFSRNSAWCLADELPEVEAKCVSSYNLDELPQHLHKLDIIFLATPPDVSMILVKQIHESEIKIIDLSGAFRLEPAAYLEWYGSEHIVPELLSSAVYGLSPWWIKKQDPKTVNLIANPGCYATCVAMTLIPLLQKQVISHDNIIIDAKSGLSGAGRAAKKELLFCEMDGDHFPYKIGKHQHTPEIAKCVEQYSGQQIKFTLMTHLLPLRRGIALSVYTDVHPQLYADDQTQIEEQVLQAYLNVFEDYPLVHFGALTDDYHQNLNFISLKRVVGSCRIHIGFKVIGKKIIIFSVIDNLLKGAAGQGIENMNALIGLPLETGLYAKEGLL